MKLFYYEHCPFCTRARMILGLRNVSFTPVVLLNDDEETPNRLIGKKMLPILVKDDGQAMGESLDIVAYVDAHAGGATPLTTTVRDALQAWLDGVNHYAGRLLMPREIHLGLPEFATESAIAYFTHKKTEMIGDFTQNMARSDVYIQQLHTDLNALDRLILDTSMANGTSLSMEDILLFPVLRNLTMVANVVWPKRVRDYVEHISHNADIPLFFAQAI